MYLALILYDHNEHASNFFEKFGAEQEDYCQEDLMRLAAVKTKDQIKGNELAEIYRYLVFNNLYFTCFHHQHQPISFHGWT